MSAMLLRIIACVSMLLDHIGYQYDIEFLRCVGRIAFPIFVFLICNGYRHTASKVRYGLRLAVFALISQVPYSLFLYNTIWREKGNVFVTLLLALLCIWTIDALLKKNLWPIAFLPTLVICGIYHFGVIESDYGIRGILFVLVFFFFARDGRQEHWLLIAGMLCAIYYPVAIRCLQWFLGGIAPTITGWEETQIYSLFALPLILSYNGQKGSTPDGPILSKLTQWGFYLFYPAHMLVLWMIRTS